ncbi:MAG: sigma 54-interacting transcriptional regulator [Thermodesulfobacteriota bacterium]
MKIDEKEFFREFTLRICSSLEIEKALWRCFQYIRDVIPTDELFMAVYDPGLGTVDVVVTADMKGGVAQTIKTPIPPEVREHLESLRHDPDVRILDDIYEDPVTKLVAKTFKAPRSQVMIGRLIIEGEIIGALCVRSGGREKYTPDHARLWALVNEPSAVALSNSLKYRELLRLKEILSDDNRYLQAELRHKVGEEVIGANFGLKEVMQEVRHVAPLPSPVLLLGETGTGKELIAGAIHNLSLRSRGPFIKVNCGAIPETLVDSELFGHEKGAFTGALNLKRGRFERAHEGTIFLDEIGELPLHAQTRLLRVLQEREIERVGGTAPIKVDIRIISATNRNLETMVSEGHFREDLYYRIRVFPIIIPPLRNRKSDIPILVHHFIQKKIQEMGLPWMPAVAPGALDRLLAYRWPGNVRELENAVERALILCEGKPLQFDDIASPPAALSLQENIEQDRQQPLSLDEVNARHIRKVLQITAGRVEGKEGAAELLKINPGTLRHRMKMLGVPFGRRAK